MDRPSTLIWLGLRRFGKRWGHVSEEGGRIREMGRWWREKRKFDWTVLGLLGHRR